MRRFVDSLIRRPFAILIQSRRRVCLAFGNPAWTISIDRPSDEGRQSIETGRENKKKKIRKENRGWAIFAHRSTIAVGGCLLLTLMLIVNDRRPGEESL